MFNTVFIFIGYKVLYDADGAAQPLHLIEPIHLWLHPGKSVRRLVIKIYCFEALLNMQSIRSAILRHVSTRKSTGEWGFFTSGGNMFKLLRHQICTSTGASNAQIMDRVIGLVKKYDKIDASKVTETADFRKDLCLDSLDRVELVMAFEEEFSIEIPDEKADKLTCCADVAKYVVSRSGSDITKS
ncbi:acyl carrier protein 3, mitochondrial [Herrania umbratica]|uniref:Acyl carrier protein n=1 Tax=Herrania umbratica TaxID=108875 RepID=A0A6J1B773_9ROSI|nr:acyl carrier protein 3, mitochondrial [Herrania umbratica]